MIDIDERMREERRQVICERINVYNLTISKRCHAPATCEVDDQEIIKKKKEKEKLGREA